MIRCVCSKKYLEVYIKDAIKKVFSSVVSQGVIVLISGVTGFIMPLFMGAEQYGYWQIYYLYFIYLNIFALGYDDGIILHYGGKKYNELPAERFQNASAVFSLQTAVLTCAALIVVNLLSTGELQFIYSMLAVNIPLICAKNITMSAFLASGNIKLFNALNLTIRILTAVIYSVLLILKLFDFHYYIISDILSRIVVVVICLIYGRKLFVWKKPDFKAGVAELKEKEISGFKITLGTLSAGFIVVVGRIVIQQFESISTFGIYSFAITLINIVTAFTLITGMVLFPILKRLNDSVIKSRLPSLRLAVDSIVLFALLFYIPLVIIITHIMPEYSGALAYLPILIVAAVPLGQNQILLITYYKAFRLETKFLLINLLYLALMGLATFLAYWLTNTVLSIAIATTVVIFLWNLTLENALIKKIQIQPDYRNRIITGVMSLIFVMSAYFLKLRFFTIIYAASLLVYALLNKKAFLPILKRLFISK